MFARQTMYTSLRQPQLLFSPRSLLFSSRVPINPSPSDWWSSAWPPTCSESLPGFPPTPFFTSTSAPSTPSTDTRRTFILNWLCVALPTRRSSFHAAITAPPRHRRFIMRKLSRFNSLMHPALFIFGAVARHHVLEMIVFANEIWQIASITLNLPQNCTSTQAGRSFFFVG